MEVFIGGVLLVFVGLLTFGFLEIQGLREEVKLVMRCIDSTDDLIDSKISPAVEENTSALETLAVVLGDQDRRINDTVKKLDSALEGLSKDKSILTIDEALAKVKGSKRKGIQKSVKKAEKVLQTALFDKKPIKKSPRAIK